VLIYRRKEMKRKIIIWVVIIAAAAGLLTLRTFNKDKEKYVAVKTEKIVQGDIKAYLSTTGTIKSKSSKDYFSLQGKVRSVNVKVGDSVSKGQILVQYEGIDPNIAVRQAQIQYDNAVLAKQIQVNSNNDIKYRMEELDKQLAELDSQIEEARKNPQQDAVRIVTLGTQRTQLKQSRDTIRAPFSNEQLKQSENAIALAKINLDSAKQNLSRNQDKLTAEADGVVTAVNVVQGATSMPSAQPAVTVQDLNSLKALVAVGKYDANKVQMDQEALVKSGGKEYKGKVSFIDPAAKKTVSATGAETSLGIEVDILDSPTGLKVDFDADVDILLGQVNSVTKAPAESVRTNKEGKAFVYIVEGNKAIEKEVRLGLQSDMDVQIIEGVKVGDKVILNPGESVKDGTFIKET
jgi:HlyD family secretion protein